MTRKAFLEGLHGGPPPAPRPINLAHPGNAHFTACVCGHAPEDHDQQAGCIVLVEVEDGWTGGAQSLGEDFCPCTAYEVAP